MSNTSHQGTTERSVVTLEQALTRTREESVRAFARHVNPIEAQMFRVGDFDKLYERADGVFLYDETGRRYMDLTAGAGALSLGHQPAEVLDAVTRARTLPTVLLMGVSPLAGALAEALSDILPGELSVACFGSGGAESVENALKIARAATGRTRFVACENGYHGLSFGAMSVTGHPRYAAAFGPLVEHCEFVPRTPTVHPRRRSGTACGASPACPQRTPE